MSCSQIPLDLLRLPAHDGGAFFSLLSHCHVCFSKYKLRLYYTLKSAFIYLSTDLHGFQIMTSIA